MAPSSRWLLHRRGSLSRLPPSWLQPGGTARNLTSRRFDERFDEFYQGGYRRLVGQVFLLTGDLHEAEDIAQEAFTRAAARWEQIRGHDVPAAWVRRAAINLATDAARRARRRLAALSRLGEAPVVPALRAEEVALTEALRRLPMRYRETIVLHHLLDLPVEQVAAHLAT